MKPRLTKTMNKSPKSWKIRTTKDGVDIYTNKYTEEQKLFMIHLIGQMMAPMEIAACFKKEYGIELTHPQSLINNYKKAEKWKHLIEKLQTEYLANVHEVAGSHKRVRLERADRIYNRAYNSGKLSIALSATEHQRKEMEEKGIDSLHLVFQQYNSMSDESLQERIAEITQKVVTLQNGGKQIVNIEGGVGQSEPGKEAGVPVPGDSQS